MIIQTNFMNKAMIRILLCMVAMLLGSLNVSIAEEVVNQKVAERSSIKEEAVIEINPVQADENQQAIEAAITTILTQYHYADMALDEKMSERIFNQYIKDLDPQKIYFLQSDIDQYAKYKSILGKQLSSGNLSPSFELYNLLLTRIEKQTKTVIQFLEEETQDFTQKETVTIDRKDLDRETEASRLEAVWKKRAKHELLNLMLTDLELKEAKEKLIKRYRSRLKRLNQTSARDVFQLYMNSVASTFDPHSTYFSPRSSENFNIQMSLSLQGIGAVLRQEYDVITVVEVVTGGPADLSGQIEVKDEIVAVAQGDNGEFEDIVGMRLDDAVDKIRGKKGSVVRLQVVSGRSKTAPMKEVRIVRDTIKLEEQAAKSKIIESDHNGQNLDIGVITLPTFYSDFEGARTGKKDFRSTTSDVQALLEALMQKNIDGLVIDLRGNGGGSLKEVIDLSGLFVGTKPIVQIKDQEGSIVTETSSRKEPLYKGPMIVLVDRQSASASEIFAAAMQDQGRALVLGNTTYGKGTVQTVIDLENVLFNIKNPGQLKLTIAKFYRANGHSTQHKGVIPDLVMPTLISNEMLGESTQETALPYDEIPEAKGYVKDDSLLGYLKELERRHNTRLKEDPALIIFQEQADDILKYWQLKSFSLNLKERKDKQEMQEKQDFERENKLRKIYNLPLITEEEIKNHEDDYEEQFNDENKKEKPDVVLHEGINILKDLIELMNKNSKQLQSKAA